MSDHEAEGGQNTLATLQTSPSVPTRHLHISNRKLLNRLRVVEVLFCVLCALFCVGNIISCALAMMAIVDAKDAASNHNVEYKDADSQMAIAGWLALVSTVACIFHLIVIILPVFYPPFAVEKGFKPYLITNTALYILFGILLFIGGIPSTIYSNENRQLWNDVCRVHDPDLNKFCENLKVIRTAEISSAVLSFISIFMFALLFFVMLYGGFMIKVKGHANRISNFTSHPQDEPNLSLEMTHSPHHTTNTADQLPSVTHLESTLASRSQYMRQCTRLPSVATVNPLVKEEPKEVPLCVLDEPPAYEFEELPEYDSVVTPYNELILETPL